MTTGLHPVATRPATVSHAAAEAIAAGQALSQLARAHEGPGPTPALVNVLTAGCEAITHGLLAVAAAIEDTGGDTADAVTDLGGRLAVVDDTLCEVASEIAGAAEVLTVTGRWRRTWRCLRRLLAAEDLT